MSKKNKQPRQYEEHIVEIEGNTYRYESSGQGAMLLLIAGGGMEPGLYGKIAEKLSKNYCVINLARIGRAKMGERREDLTLDEEAEFFLPLIKQLKIEYVVGHSSGAVLATVIASKYPVKGMVIYEPPITDSDWWFEPFRKLRDEGHYVRAIRLAMKGMAAAPFDKLPAFITLPIFNFVYKKNAPYVLTFEKCILSEMNGLNPVYERLKAGEKITVPTMVCIGEKTSKMLKEAGEAYFNACTQGTLKWYPKYSHINPLMTPELFCADTVEYFQGLETQA